MHSFFLGITISTTMFELQRVRLSPPPPSYSHIHTAELEMIFCTPFTTLSSCSSLMPVKSLREKAQRSLRSFTYSTETQQASGTV